jgi:hypothetical protein
MGRYAFFSTGIEYKFVFAAQESSDIELFGTGYIDYDTSYGHRKWTEADIPLLKKHLSRYIVDLSLYPTTTEGTNNLLWSLCTQQLPNDIVLGFVIYHQLLYSCPLTVQYEL